MKNLKLSFILLAIAITNIASAQDTTIRDQSNYETLFSKHKPFGGYLGLYGSIANFGQKEPYASTGANLAMTFNRKLSIGVAAFGYSSINAIPVDNIDTGKMFFQGGYGGLFIEPIIFPNKLVHVGFPVIIGGGSSGYFYNTFTTDSIHNVEFRQQRTNYVGSNAYFIFKPGINIELNVARFMRIGITTSYALTSHIVDYKVKNQPSIDGLNIGFNIRLGWF